MMSTRLLIYIGIAGLFALLTLNKTVWSTPNNGKKFIPYFNAAEKENDLPAGLLSRMAYQESRYNPTASGRSGEVGIMQIIPRWHPGVDATNPIESIQYAGRLMRRYYNRFGSWDKALAAYNWGPTALQKYGLIRAPESTKKYIKDILGDIGIGTI